MVKLYETTYTYLPFIYLFSITAALSILYHSPDPTLQVYRPYTVLWFILVNTLVYRYYKSPSIIRCLIHKITWKCVTNVVFGIVGNLVHEMVFHDHHFDQYHHNLGWSALYLLSMLLGGYALKSPEALTVLNIVFLFVPIKRVWQVNLYAFTMFVSISIFMTYSKASSKTLGDNDLQRMPLMRYFPYLRIQDELIWVGFVQLYIEYYQLFMPDMEAVASIEETLKSIEVGGDQ